ncbi:hypothetical protein LTR10_019281 [Elasticomyces elasticus]|uniref:Tachykinin family protein n=1 Tax=Exophiala sideris TaxID=1016849 RepID=A0ABR0IWX9_9EURO|nr:hypothetical protein LTR10_019281 [Elasticomyces elasticus]KAK5021959.1 hypothetical protein LTS07_010541 [Exophiala sideris]KAK5026022.1 hypothetical protein LTR13_010179 [Exophiala sideris]KAK5050709.1 hypothetical protein LTR69_010565 [Exophiala sideris]KAK5177194.1 hypothetical protein LTR44_010322 [Eurotiomycetes sp. CCFEE 6388]
MAPSPQTNLFITYNSPSEFKSQKNRKAVSSFASRSYRATSKKINVDRNNYRPFVLRSDASSTPSSSASPTPSPSPAINAKRTTLTRKRASTSTSNAPDVENHRAVQPLDERALGSPIADPFTSYPIDDKPYIPFLIDYCNSNQVESEPPWLLPVIPTRVPHACALHYARNADGGIWWPTLVIRSLTPRFSPALGVESSRYLVWFNVAMQHSELFHALIALSQVYYNIDVKGFGSTHWTALYHRGESLKQLRYKVESGRSADDDAAILTALWLMDVEASHGDLQAYSMHKRAKERMVATRGGIRALDPSLQDELLKSEFFLGLLLYGSFFCEVTDDGNVLVRFKENYPVQSSQVGGFQGLFSVLASKGLITSQAVDILQGVFEQMSRDPRFVQVDSTVGMSSPGKPPPLDQASNEMSRVLRMADEARPVSLHQRLLLALLIYIFNLHNQPQPLPAVSSPASAPATVRHPYLDILSKVALELSCPSHPSNPRSVTEREVTLWTMVAIGSASTFSPWRSEIPFMGHLIEWMENDEEEVVVQRHQPHVGEPASGKLSTDGFTVSTTSNNVRKGGTHLERLTACLRGYYLYGADKKTLRSLRQWRGTDNQRG